MRIHLFPLFLSVVSILISTVTHAQTKTFGVSYANSISNPSLCARNAITDYLGVLQIFTQDGFAVWRDPGYFSSFKKTEDILKAPLVKYLGFAFKGSVFETKTQSIKKVHGGFFLTIQNTPLTNQPGKVFSECQIGRHETGYRSIEYLQHGRFSDQLWIYAGEGDWTYLFTASDRGFQLYNRSIIQTLPILGGE